MHASKDDEVGRPGTTRVTFDVPDMDCPSCARNVGKALQGLPGVDDSELKPMTGSVTVSFQPGVTEVDEIVGAIERAGYPVAGRHDQDPTSKKRIPEPAEIWGSRRARRTAIGAVFLTGGLFLAFVVTEWDAQIASTPLFDITAADVSFIVAILASGIPIVRNAYSSARRTNLDIQLLMGAAILAASAIGLFVEAATLAVLFSVAELLERYAVDRTRDSLRSLLALTPDEATVRRAGTEVTVPIEAVAVGETVLVRPGEKIPVDGAVSVGASAVDQSPITGESVPLEKDVGDRVYAGSLNEDGFLEVTVAKPSSESTLSRVIDLVREAEANKTEREQFVDRFARYYTPVIVVLAVMTAVLPPTLIDGTFVLEAAGITHTFVDSWRVWFVRGLTLLVIACPCALVISTPVSVTSGVTAAARNGVLIKGGNHLEAMGEVEAIAFDKTGTLTRGELAVTDVIPLGSVSKSEVLRVAGGLERRSTHPIAEAVLAHARAIGVDPPAVTDFERLPGRGVRGRLDGNTYLAGNHSLFGDNEAGGPQPRPDGGIAAHSPTTASAVGDRLESAGKTVVMVGDEDEILGVLGIADEVRPEARQAIDQLRRLGIDSIVMLTGDNEGTAKAVASNLGIDEYRAGLLPGRKAQEIEALQGEHGTVAMVGDGVNDAPALAVATVGLAMGAAGTDAAIETADIALMGDDLLMLPYLYALSRKANGVIRQNIWSSLGVKLLLALGVPFGYVSVALAVLVGDMGMSLGVTGNAMRLAGVEPEMTPNEDVRTELP